MPRIRTGYSFQTAVGKIEDVMARLKVCQYLAAPITDRASTFGWVRWDKLCKKNEMKPVFGVELGVTRSLNEKKMIIDYWTFIATDDLLAVNELFELATTQFGRFEPFITYQQAMKAQGLVKIVGYRSDFKEFEPKDNLFIGLSPSCAKGYINDARKLGHNFIATSDNKWTNPGKEGKVLYETICGRGASTQSYDQFIQSHGEWEGSINSTDPDFINQSWANREALLYKCKAKLKKSTLLTPSKFASLQAMCEEGAKRIGCDLSNPVYSSRLKKELDLIESKKFEDYFYIIADLCQWARKKMLVGPARGSSCGSLVCYLLEITTVDPIPDGLIFERFIDVNRDDMPDIDIDFSDRNRHLVFEYLAEKYGQSHVAKLGTVAVFKGASSINEAGKAFLVPKWKCDAVVQSLLKRSGGDARALDTLEDTFQTMEAGKELVKEFPEMMIVTKMEGHPNHYSTHAAGIILTQDPVNHYVAVDRSTGSTQCDKKDAEDLNLLKIDALGLTQLSIFEMALDMAGLDRLHLEKVNREDPAAIKVLNDGKFCGIFQFEGLALQSIAKQFKLQRFDDIVSVTTLGRPGPLASGGAHEWVRRRNKVHPVTYPHPMFEPYLNQTLGIVLYQEQVMEIGRNIGDLSWGDVTALRKAMSKSLGKEYFDQFGNKWKAAAVKRGGDPKAMQKVWDDLCAYGSWSFNKSHAVAYGVISQWCCWLKAHYPFEFAAATLSHQGDPDKQLKMLREMVAEGYKYISVDQKLSTDKWNIGTKNGERYLIGPFTNIKGIGPKTIQTIMSSRARGEELPSKVQKLFNKAATDIDSLFPISDAFKRVLPDPAARNIHTPPTPIKEVEIKNHDYDVLVFCILSKINPRDENEAVNIARRNGKVMTGNLTASLNLQLTDDTDTIFCKVGRYDYVRLGKEIVDRGKPGKLLYAIKGVVKGGGSFRMIMAKNVRYIGELNS